VILWDGAGGTADGIDYDAADDDAGRQVDAIANHADALFDAVIANDTAAAFSLRTPGDVSSLGLAADVGVPVYYETVGGAIGAWATPPVVDRMTPPRNLDGLEVWGAEGPTPAHSDADRFSVAGDPAAAGGPRVSVFNADSTTYLLQSILASAVIALDPVLTGIAGLLGEPELMQLIDLDALMVSDVNDIGIWDAGDRILFSLWPILDPLSAATLYVGDAAYVLTNTGAASVAAFFDHGGHLWTDGWTAAHFGQAWNVDALEALAAVPEPGILGLLAAGLIVIGIARRRRT
jgi:hypothetical protein